MKAHCLQHVSFEGMGEIERWLLENQFSITYTRFFESTDMPDIKSVDWVIIMGGPMSVNDGERYPWLAAEKEWVRKCIVANKVVIGVCLGAQIICSALGSKVFKNAAKEIGWFPICKNAGLTSRFGKLLPDQLMVFHWHGETFDLPEHAELIASSEACRNQVFSVDNNVLGFQCHLETNTYSLGKLIDNCKDELVPGRYIQKEIEMLDKEKEYASGMHEVLFRLLNGFLKA